MISTPYPPIQELKLRIPYFIQTGMIMYFDFNTQFNVSAQ